MVVYAGRSYGQYYGVQGTTWTHPPILDNPSGTITDRAAARYQLFYDGKRLRLVAWRTTQAVYWVSNTLLADADQRADARDRRLAHARSGTLTRPSLASAAS